MRGINYLAALGTLFLFAGIFCFKALNDKKTFKEETDIHVPLKNSQKRTLILAGFICMVIGLLLILKALKLV